MTVQSRPLLTYTEVIGQCHGLPYPSEQEYAQITSEFYQFRLKKVWNPDPSVPYIHVGWIVPSTASNLPWTHKFLVDHRARTIDIPYPAEHHDRHHHYDFSSSSSSSEEQRQKQDSYETLAIAEQLSLANSLSILGNVPTKLQQEHYRVLPIRDRSVRISRFGSALFGIQTFGVQMTAYTTGSLAGEIAGIWSPKRSATRMKHAGWMDNTVGGGALFDDGTDPMSCLVREAREEASLPAKYVKEHAKCVGTISYWFVRDDAGENGGKVGFVDRSIQFVYDLELPGYIVPKPGDDEVEEFYLWGVEETVIVLREGRFKTNGAVTLVDFLVRRGLVSGEGEDDDLDRVRGLVDRRPFPKSFTR